jgi:hypothetical protein
VVDANLLADPLRVRKKHALFGNVRQEKTAMTFGKNVPNETFESMVRIEAVVYGRLKKLCEKHGLIAAAIVSRLVAEYLENPAKFRAGRFLPEPKKKARKAKK